MRKLVVVEGLSLDGVMQAPGHPDEDRSGGFEHGGWQMPYFDEATGVEIAKSMAETDAFLFGRTTYEIMAAHWPNVPEGDMFGDVLNGRPKYVASTTLEEPLAWNNSTLLKGDVADAVSALKTESGNNIVVLGSGQLARTLMENDLVDEYSLTFHPLVLGTGKRLFEDSGERTQLRLVDSRTSSTGAIWASYVPEGR
jgi:dihydrofolate reductase